VHDDPSLAVMPSKETDAAKKAKKKAKKAAQKIQDEAKKGKHAFPFQLSVLSHCQSWLHL
jgi:hypothetical protein